MNRSLELSKEGIKVSYIRFLSDSAAGFVLILLVVIVVKLRLPLPIIGTSYTSLYSAQASQEFKVFFLVICFVISTPLGLMLNGAGWFTLGAFQGIIVRVWALLPSLLPISFFVIGTRESYQVSDTFKFFDLGERNKKLYNEANFYGEFLDVYFPSIHSSLDPARGLKIFTRSLSFLSLVTAIYSLLALHKWPMFLWMSFVFIIMLMFSSLLEYYQCLKTLCIVFIIVVKLHMRDLNSKSPQKHSRKEVLDELIAVSVRLRSAQSPMNNV